MFVLKLNKKFYKELDYNMQLFIEYLYPNIKACDIIKAFLSKEKIKCDFYIEVNDKKFKISVKMGNKNSVHTEELNNFIKFLKFNLKLSDKLIKYYLYYHFGDFTIDGSGNKRISAFECKEIYRDNLIKLNESLNNEINIELAAKRFLFGSYNIDYLITGTADDFIWISNSDIIELLKIKKFENKLSPYFSSLTIQPLSRSLNFDEKLDKYRYMVQVKWYNLYDDIIEYYNKKTTSYYMQ